MKNTRYQSKYISLSYLYIIHTHTNEVCIIVERKYSTNNTLNGYNLGKRGGGNI